MSKLYIGIDNGVSGSIGFSHSAGASMVPTPVFKTLNYTKSKKKYVTRIDRPRLLDLFREYRAYTQVLVLIERPMVNPGRFQASASALRALESTLTAIEEMEWGYQFVDSKHWQKELLPSGVKGAPELKRASEEIGCRLFPHCSELIRKHGDADGLLIAEWGRRAGL